MFPALLYSGGFGYSSTKKIKINSWFPLQEALASSCDTVLTVCPVQNTDWRVYSPNSSVRYEEWGSEEAFDAFVRKEFPGLVMRGKELFMRRPVTVLKETLDLLF